MNIEKEKVVSINYTLRNDEGEILDSSEGREPLLYIQGIGNLIPGLEAVLEGKTTGDTIKATIAPADAYGEFNKALISQVPRSQFQGVDNVEVGMQFQAHSEQGDQVVTITNIENDIVTVDGNHPLAGVTLHFDVNVVAVREATKEELEHGHVHGSDGHHHH